MDALMRQCDVIASSGVPGQHTEDSDSAFVLERNAYYSQHGYNTAEKTQQWVQAAGRLCTWQGPKQHKSGLTWLEKNKDPDRDGGIHL